MYISITCIYLFIYLVIFCASIYLFISPSIDLCTHGEPRQATTQPRPQEHGRSARQITAARQASTLRMHRNTAHQLGTPQEQGKPSKADQHGRLQRFDKSVCQTSTVDHRSTAGHHGRPQEHGNRARQTGAPDHRPCEHDRPGTLRSR